MYGDAVELILETRFLHEQFFLVEVVLDKGWATTVGEHDVPEHLAQDDVLAQDLVVLHVKEAVVLPVMLRLLCHPQQIAYNQISFHLGNS